MASRTSYFALTIPLLLCLSSAQADPIVESKSWKVLHDFSDPLPRAASLPESKRREILKLVFPKHLENQDLCAATGKQATVPGKMRKTVCSPLIQPGASKKDLAKAKKESDCEAHVTLPQPEVDLKLGNFLTELKWMVTGSFTEIGSPQNAALVNVQYCSGGSSNRLVVLSQGKVVQEQDLTLKVPYLSPPYIHSFDYGSGAKAIDVNGDGRSEILMHTEFYATMDEDYSYASLWTLKEKGWEQAASFDQTTNSRCDSYYTPEEQFLRVKVVQYRAPGTGKFPEFQEEEKSLSCSTQTR